MPGLRATVALTAMVVLAVAGCREAGPSVAPSPSGATALPAPAAGPYVTTGRGPMVPQDGAWFGAYADAPRRVGNQLAAVDEFEALIGRPLAVAHSFHPWGEPFPSTLDRELVHRGKLLLISWAGTDTRSIAGGVYDDLIRRQAEQVRDFRVPILLRFRWEMDRPNLRTVVHSPEDFVAAWRHVRAIFTEVGALNAAWVWCPRADAFADGTAASYYPGDGEVDWVCADVYPGPAMRGFTELMAPVLEFARARPRPVLIGEFGLQERVPGARAAWFDEMRSLLASQPQVKGVVYFSARQDRKPAFDTTVTAPEQTLAAFRALAADPCLRAMPGW